MARKKKTMGAGAVISVLSKLIHPSEHIREKFINPVDGHRLEGGVVLRLETKSINRRDQRAIVFRHEDFESVELYAVQRFCRIETEGHSDHFFKENSEEGEGEQLQVANLDEMEGEVLPESISELIVNVAGHNYVEAIDVQQIRNYVETDVDNQPLAENLGDVSNDNDVCSKEWGHNNICPRKQVTNGVNVMPTLNVDCFNRLDLFEALFITEFVKETIIPTINKSIEGRQVTYGEFLQWLGLWFLMGSVIGPSRRSFFFKKSCHRI